MRRFFYLFVSAVAMKPFNFGAQDAFDGKGRSATANGWNMR